MELMQPLAITQYVAPDQKTNNPIVDNASFNRIIEDFENDLFQIERTAAEQLYAYYREVLAKYRTGQHQVAVWAAKNACGLTIDGQLFRSSIFYTQPDPIATVLRHIEDSLQYRFAYFLAGRPLN
jgi:hypothetical protein